jgi:hypothetical protein
MDNGPSKASSAFLAAYYDPGVAIRDENPVEIERGERERLLTLYVVAQAASQIPRRIGGDAELIELREDKKRCRRVAHVARQCLEAWGGETTKAVPKDVRKEAAQVVWDKWWEAHQVVLRTRLTYIANWGLVQDADTQRWAKGAVQRLQNELNWLNYALR